MYALINSKIYTSFSILEENAIVISGNFIKDICPIHCVPSYIKTYDLLGLSVSPGFIDLQLNGCGGVQFNDNIQSISIQTLEIMKTTNRLFGCTSFLPTLITSNDILIKKAIEVTRVFLQHNNNQVLGLHLEGPFINILKKGIHNPSLIRLPTQNMVDYLCDNSDIIKKITLAPEQLSMGIIEKFKKSGIIVSIGHSNATYQDSKSSFNFGITLGTHLFNAMPPLIARDPGIIGAIFDSPEIYCTIIADGIHVHWANIKLAKRTKLDHLVLITDGTSPAGLSDTKDFIFSGQTISCHNNICKNNQGTLGGSNLTMIQAIKNSVEHAGIPLDEALRMATLYPARALGIDHSLGSLKKNKIANLAIFDNTYQIKKTIVNGKLYTISS